MHFGYKTLKIDKTEVDSHDFNIRKEKEEIFKFLLNKNLAIYLSNHNISPTYLSEKTGFSVQHFSNILKYKDLKSYKEVTNNKSLGLFCLYRVLEELEITLDPFLNFENKGILCDSDNEIEDKKQFLINKIKNIDNPKVIEKLIFDINFLDSLSQENDDFNY